ncbi:YggT family protein [Erythrobacter sp. YJ-T3-07]|uniref:YggT family protein n=1 Tax=Erythrobacter sp. YJ-T3-07 TaxID=2793063 RepID=UPI0018D4AC3D|nr:YggT family protein [Erythrobacter sp. YJ-T3-07]MBH1943163.1 YggT family protein [Erythrobacter sp. YJ-T3-07]
MQALFTIYQIVELLTNVFVMLIIVQFVIGLLLAFNVVSRGNDFVVAVYRSINSLLDPVLSPIRKMLPQTGAIDFSPLVLIIVLQIFLIILSSVIRSLA